MTDWVPYRAQCVACGCTQTALIGPGPDHVQARVGLPCTNCGQRLVMAWEQRLEPEEAKR